MIGQYYNKEIKQRTSLIKEHSPQVSRLLCLLDEMCDKTVKLGDVHRSSGTYLI